MNIYIVNIEKGYSKTHESLNVLAKNASEAIDNALRYAKSKYYSDASVVSVYFDKKVDVFYKSAPKPKAKKRK